MAKRSYCITRQIYPHFGARGHRGSNSGLLDREMTPHQKNKVMLKREAHAVSVIINSLHSKSQLEKEKLLEILKREVPNLHHGRVERLITWLINQGFLLTNDYDDLMLDKKLRRGQLSGVLSMIQHMIFGRVVMIGHLVSR